MSDEITRIVIEPLADGRFRWRLWSGDRLVHDELSQASTVDAIFGITRVLATGEIEHAEEETRSFPRGIEN